MSKDTVVVTGGRGFVGKYLVRELQQHWAGARIVVWDKPEKDITKPGTYGGELKELQPEWVVHLAAVASVSAALENPDLVRKVNVDATEALLGNIEEISPDTKVFVASSADVYGSVSTDPIPELPLNKAKPNNPYARSKWEVEKIIEERFYDRCLRVRSFPHIGPGQKTGFVTADFASQIAAVECGVQEPVIKVGNLEAKRDFTDVRDVVHAYRLLMEKGKFGQACPANEQQRGVCGVYHVASGIATSIRDILDKLLSMSTVKIAVEQDPERVRPSDNPVVVGDSAKLRKLVGWQPKVSLEQSLRDILVYWRDKAGDTSLA